MATTRRILGCRLVALVVMALVLLTGLGCTASGSDRTGSPVPGAATSTPLPGAGEQVQTSSTRTAEQSTRPTPASRPKVGAGEPSAEIAEIERTVRQRINEIRREQGLAPLEADRELARVARQYSCAMAEQGFFSHTSPSGETVADRVREAGKQYRLVGENIAKLVNPAPRWPPSRDGCRARGTARTSCGRALPRPASASAVPTTPTT